MSSPADRPDLPPPRPEQGSLAIPYTPETATIIQGALDAYEASADPSSVPQAASFIDDLWWLCSPGGYATLVSKSIATAQVSVARGDSLFPGVSTGRPRILINGM